MTLGGYAALLEDIRACKRLRARSATLTEDDVATLNSCTIENRVANGEIPPERAIIRLNRSREEANLVHLREFARKRGQ